MCFFLSNLLQGNTFKYVSPCNTVVTESLVMIIAREKIDNEQILKISRGQKKCITKQH